LTPELLSIRKPILSLRQALISLFPENAVTRDIASDAGGNDRSAGDAGPSEQPSSELRDRGERSVAVTVTRPSHEEKLDALARQLEAVCGLYMLHWQALYAMAKRRLEHARIAEGEYAAEEALQSGLGTFLERIKKGEIDTIADDTGALRILRRLIMDKVIARSRRIHALKHNPAPIKRHRKSGGVDDIGDEERDHEQQARIADTIDMDHCGVDAAEVDLIASEEAERLLGLLGPERRKIAKMRLDGYSIAETALLLGLSERTVDRRLEDIKEIWRNKGGVDDRQPRRGKATG
jgi:RNA polymerase sigma factor (sigma-70 family)